MIKNLSLLLLTPFLAFALSIPELQLPESLSEKKRGNEFLQLIWNTDSVVADVEMTPWVMS